MSVNPHWPTPVATGLDPQQQYLHVSQAATASLSTTTLYAPKTPHSEGYSAKQLNSVGGHRQQPQLVQPSFIVTQPQQLPTAYNTRLLPQGITGGGQCSQLQPLNAQVLELQQPGSENLVAYQPQQAMTMPGIYNPANSQQLIAPIVYKTQQPTMTIQSSEFQSNQRAPFVLNPPQPTGLTSHHQEHSVVSNPTYTQSVLNKLIRHEPCIHTLTYLEAQIESQKQIGESQSEQLKTLWEQSALQEQEVERLKLEVRAKERTIEELRSEIDNRKVVENQKVDVPRLRAVIKEQREELERLHKRCPDGLIGDNQKVDRFTSAEGGPLKGPLIGQQVEDPGGLADKVNRLNLKKSEISRLVEENQTFRLEIGRLERENSEVTRLRSEVLELSRRLKEVKPLQNKPIAALDQSVSSTGLSGHEAMSVQKSHAGDQVSFSRTK